MTGDDYARIGDDDAERLVVFLGNQAFMRLARTHDVGHCAALVVSQETGAFLCSIYDRRPDVCRDLERASPACEGERTTKRDRPRRALRVL